MRNFLFLFIAAVGLFSPLQAQDIHFSQFYAAPLNLNPALTGVMNANQRISVNYRNQWASVLRGDAFNTYNASYDNRIAVGRYDFIGIGGSLWGDKAGSLNFSTTQLHGSFSYSKRMSGYRSSASYLVMGFDAGVSQRGLDLANARWGSQNSGGVWDPTLPSGEGQFAGRNNFFYPEAAAGLMWFTTINEHNNYYIGGAYSHINRANQSFTSTTYVPLASKFTVHAGGEFELAERMSMLPGAVVFLQGPSKEINFGTSFRFKLGSSRIQEEGIQFGLWSRLSNKINSGLLIDAVIASTRFDYNDFSIGFSYDINVSPLSAASNGNGGFEFSLIYKIFGPESRDVYCPNF